MRFVLKEDRHDGLYYAGPGEDSEYSIDINEAVVFLAWWDGTSRNDPDQMKYEPPLPKGDWRVVPVTLKKVEGV